MEKDGVAEEKPPIEEGRRSVAPGMAEEVAEVVEKESAGSDESSVAALENGSVAGEGGSSVDEEDRMEMDGKVDDLRSRISDEYVLVDGKIVPMKNYFSTCNDPLFSGQYLQQVTT